MGNLNAVAQGDLALASVLVAGGVPAFGFSRGFAAAIVDNGVGDYTLELSNAQSLDDSAIVSVTPQGATPLCIAVEAVDETHVRVRFLDNAGAAADSSFWIRITPVAPQ